MPKIGTVTEQLDIGKILRETREARGIDINSVALQINLRTSIIEKLENNEFADIGAPVFTRGYLHLYARFLGIDEEVVNEGFSVIRSSSPSNETLRLNTANIESQNKPYHRPMHRGWISLALVIIIGGALIIQLIDNQSWLMQQIRGAFTQQDNGNSVSTQNGEESNIDSAKKQPEISIEVVDYPKDLPLASLGAEDVNTADISAAGELAAPELTLSSLDNEGNSVDDINNSENVSEPEVESVTQNNVVDTSKNQDIVLKTSQQNWIEIKNKNGKVVHSQTYNAGTEIVLKADDAPYRFNIGRPDAVALTVNGEKKVLNNYRITGSSRHFKVGVVDE